MWQLNKDKLAVIAIESPGELLIAMSDVVSSSCCAALSILLSQ